MLYIQKGEGKNVMHALKRRKKTGYALKKEKEVMLFM